jgi:PIN domain nuclease of toxin-antitoxin system
VKLLLDTHAYIWWALGDSKRVSMRARKAVEARAATIYISAVSAYELAYNIALATSRRSAHFSCAWTTTSPNAVF